MTRSEGSGGSARRNPVVVRAPQPQRIPWFAARGAPRAGGSGPPLADHSRRRVAMTRIPLTLALAPFAAAQTFATTSDAFFRSGWPPAIAAVDFDGDGDADLVVPSSVGALELHTNDG